MGPKYTPSVSPDRRAAAGLLHQGLHAHLRAGAEQGPAGGAGVERYIN